MFMTHWLTCYILVFHTFVPTSKDVWMQKDKMFGVIEKGKFVGFYAFWRLAKWHETCKSIWFTDSLSQGDESAARSLMNKEKCVIIKGWMIISW